MESRIDFSNPHDVVALQKKIRISYFMLTGRYEGWEDCSQDIIVSWMQHPEWRQTVDQAVIEHLRTDTGRKGAPNYEKKLNFKMGQVSFEESGLDKVLTTKETKRTEDKLDYEALVDNLLPRHRIVTKLYYEWGLLLHEIADILGVTESRASQLLTNSEKYLSEKVLRDLEAG